VTSVTIKKVLSKYLACAENRTKWKFGTRKNWRSLGKGVIGLYLRDIESGTGLPFTLMSRWSAN
jgi:hypothetical protein